MSRPTDDRAIVDAGLKALAFDSGPPLVCDEPAATYERASDEHGRLAVSATTNRLALGGKIRTIPGHCDPSVNLYDWYACIRGHLVEQLWPITARGRCVDSCSQSVEAERRDPVRPHAAILRTEDHPLQIGLCDDQAIERIAMMRRQAAGMLGMGACHRQDLEAERQHCSDDRPIEAKLPDRSLDRDFPNRRRTDKYVVGLVLYCCPQRAPNAAQLSIPPQKNVGIDQNLHTAYSKYFCISGGSGASKSSAIYVIPNRFCPPRRFFRGD
jgi:ferredoxin